MAEHSLNKKKLIINGLISGALLGLFIAIGFILLPQLWVSERWVDFVLALVILWLNGSIASLFCYQYLFLPFLRDLLLAYDVEIGVIPAYLEDIWYMFEKISLHLLYNWGYLIAQWIVLIYLIIYEETNFEIAKKILNSERSDKNVK